MEYTPLIKKLNKQGGTFYTFSSAARDLSKCLGNSSLLEFRFSHFALLNIPDMVNVHSPNDNATDLSNANVADLTDDARFVWKTSFANSKDTGYILACMLQDYVFNFEERLISHRDSVNSDRSVAERVFWHWLYRTGAINWRDAIQGDECVTSRTRRIEDGAGSGDYNRVVKYLGNIDITNSVDINSDAYTELYIHIPAEAGDTPKVLWLNDNEGNDIFKKNEIYRCENISYILGQENENPQYTDGDNNPVGLTYGAVYDKNDNDYDDAYVTEDSDNEGVCIDWDAESYWDIMNNASLNTMDEYNASVLSDSFEFNAVLVYYDIIDKNNENRTSNLYGIMFLDDIVKVNDAEYIQRYPKYKPTEGVVNGNSYGFKLNLRIDVEPNKQGITTLVNEYNTYSMGLFADAIMRIQECTNTFMHLREEQYELSRKYDELETILKSIYSVDALKKQVDELEATIENAGMALSDSNALLDLIYNNSKQIQTLVKGGLPNALAIDLNIIKAGYNMDVNTSDGVSARLGVKNIGWQQCPLTLLNQPQFGTIASDPDHRVHLSGEENNNESRGDNRMIGVMKDGNNMIRVYTDNVSLCRYDIEVYVDDSLSSWHNGQTLRLVFPTLSKAVLNNHTIAVYTDKGCLSGEAQNGMGYGCKVEIHPADLIGDNPIIDITCTDETFTLKNDSLVADVIR